MAHITAFRARDRGAVLMTAIAVLAVMTILTMSLAASHAVAQNLFNHSSDKARLVNAAHLALDHAARSVTAGGADSFAARHESGDLKLRLNDLQVHYETLPVADSDAVYSGGFLQKRAGDLLVLVHVKGRSLVLDQKFLLNVQAGSARKISLKSEWGA